MDDSPLSIAASAAGILTFISAVIAFVYVRYQILQNGRNEISSSLEAAALGIEETKSMQHAQLLPSNNDDERHGHGHGEAAERMMKKSLQDLLRIDIEIWKECALAAGHPNPDEMGMAAGVVLFGEGEEEENDRDVERQQQQPIITTIPQINNNNDTLKGTNASSSLPLPPPPTENASSSSQLHHHYNYNRYLKVLDFLVLGSLASLVWASVKMVLRLSVGITPALLRWYGVRKEVMRMKRRRDALRSRIMHQQVLLLYMQVFVFPDLSFFF